MRRGKLPKRFCNYITLVASITNSEPSSFQEAANKQVWREAMVEEYDSIIRNDVWEVVSRPKGKSVETSKWIYKVKFAADDNIEKHKARFAARGFSQVESIDYDKTFAPVARNTSIRTIMAIAAEMGWRIHQMDVKTAFLNGILEEEVYIEQPQGFAVSGRDTHVCRLRKVIYGLKQAPRAWYSRIDTYLQDLGFEESEVDPNLYYLVDGEDLIILVVYVNDLFITRADKLIGKCKVDLAAEFEMKDIGLMHYFISMEVWQRKYAHDTLHRFQMPECWPMATPMTTNF